VFVVVALAVAASLGAAAMAWSAFQGRRNRVRLIQRLRSEWGKRRDSPGPVEGVGVYHAHRAGDAGTSIDATTWDDLVLDAVFRFLDRTECVLGREVLYHRLRRTGRDEADLAAFDALVERFRHDDAARLAVQVELTRITERGPAVAWQLALQAPDPLPPWMRWLCPGFAAVLVACIAATILKPALIALTIPAILIGLFVRAKIGWRIMPWVAPFLSVGQILEVGRRVAAVEPPSEPTTRTIVGHLPKLVALARIARWLGRDPSRSDLAALIAEYLNLFFCADGNALLLGFGAVRRHQPELLEIAEALGRLDAAIAVASVRAESGQWTRPEFVDPADAVRFTDVRHPLVDGCVPNALAFGPDDGVILTGANMTGKSTFLRTIGTNVILAQSIYTVFASSYRAPWMAVRSCISPSDELEAGKSLYQREAETVVSILTQAAGGGVTLCLFDELFRGTNSVDRIGASAAVYSYLLAIGGAAPREAGAASRCCVMAATHDLELVAFLDHGFSAYHFGDRIRADRLEFDYRLRPGVAPSRNAIALLQLLGAPAAVVADAQERANRIQAIR
jgi:hypothetical protein